MQVQELLKVKNNKLCTITNQYIFFKLNNINIIINILILYYINISINTCKSISFYLITWYTCFINPSLFFLYTVYTVAKPNCNERNYSRFKNHSFEASQRRRFRGRSTNSSWIHYFACPFIGSEYIGGRMTLTAFNKLIRNWGDRSSDNFYGFSSKSLNFG